MKKMTKLTLGNLNVQSFVTTETKEIKGGSGPTWGPGCSFICLPSQGTPACPPDLPTADENCE